MADKSQVEVVALTGAEHMLYTSGIKRGQHEAAVECAGELRNAATHYVDAYRKQAEEDEGVKANLPAIESWCSVFETLAKQLDAKSGALQTEATDLLNKAIVLRGGDKKRTLARRMQRALTSALEGWREG